ncbi:hypothetical protein CD790_00360 [Streptomyces sp. SAJ15]|nr:hypothetical protein CD790_00360 [Streptomyces sp. SAJ15]
MHGGPAATGRAEGRRRGHRAATRPRAADPRWDRRPSPVLVDRSSRCGSSRRVRGAVVRGRARRRSACRSSGRARRCRCSGSARR